MKSKFIGIIVLTLQFGFVSAADHFILNRTDVVPAYLWSAGCSPTAGTMVLGYWDWDSPGGRQIGHGVMVPYYFERFWIDSFPAPGGGYYHWSRGSGSECNTVPSSLVDIAYGMNTNSAGSTTVGYFIYNIRNGILGWGNTPYIKIDPYTYWPGMGNNWYGYEGFTIWNWTDIWNEIKDEINMNRPCVWSRDGNWSPGPSGGHSVAVIGYNDDGYIYYRSTWDLGYSADPYQGNGQSFADVTTIVPGSENPGDLSLVIPDGGEIWAGGSIHNITWYQYGAFDSIRIYWSTDRGYSWEHIYTKTNPGFGWNNYSWTTPNIDCIDVFVKVEGWDNIGGFDYITASEGSENRFSIFPRSITVSSPNGFEKWEKLNTYNITWTSYNVNLTENIRISLYKSSNFVYNIVASTPNDGAHSWQIPGTLADGTDYKIKISIVEAPTIYDYSNYNFSIYWVNAPTLRIPVAVALNQVQLSWHNNSNYAINYTISRWDTLHGWQDGYKENWTDTLFTDTVSFLYKYRYRVKAKDNAGHYSAWSNTVEFTSCMLAQSGYPKMSAFNNAAKVGRYGNNVYVVYRGMYNSINCLSSTDGGISFTESAIAGAQFITNPAISVSANGTPYIVWGQYNQVFTKGIEDPGWHLQYWVKWGAGTIWNSELLYDWIIDSNPNNPPPDTSTYLAPPSFTLSSDSGYIVFLFKDMAYNSKIISFPLANPANSIQIPFVNIPFVPGGYYCDKYPSIGYDKGDPSNPTDDRTVVLVRWVSSGSPAWIKLYFREIVSAQWDSVEIPNCLPFGSPSLWTGQNELRISFEGYNYTTQQDGLFFLPIPYQNNTYDVNQSMEIVSPYFDNGEHLLGYSYLAGPNVVLWKYLDDIWYSQRLGGEWTAPVNISQTTGPGAISSYPQGIVSGSFLRQKLFALWTEKLGDSYYLVRKIVNLPAGYPNVRTVASSDIPEAIGYNNSRRLLRDAQATLHLAFTSGNNVYHTSLQDTAWAEPVIIGEGKYPALAMGVDGRIYCIWSYNQGQPYFLEELCMSRLEGNQWSNPVPLMHTYNSFLWGVGAPSLAISHDTGCVSFKSYFGPTFHPEPGQPAPQVIVLESRHLIYGKFPLNNPELFSFNTIDAIGIPPTPVDPLVYQDSLVPLLISPSITVDLAGVPHILWEGDSTCMRYYTIVDTVVNKQLFDEGVDFPFIGMNGDQIQVFYTAHDSIRYRYSWTGTANLSQTQTIATCESPMASGQYLAWTKRENGVSHLYYGAIPASGAVSPVEINYSTDLITYPQILFNPEPASIDLVWTEYNQIDSSGYICYLNLPLTEVAPKYAFDMGQEIPVPVCIERDGYIVYGAENYKTVDYDSTELVYHLTLHSPHTKYKIRWVWYHQEQDKIKLQFNIDDILHRNRWVNPNEKVVEEAWIPAACIQDNEITIKTKKLSGTIAVLSGFEIYAEEVGCGGPQGKESQITRPFFFDRIYPNPTKGVLRIRYNSPDNRRIRINLYDVCGRLVLEENITKSRPGMNEVLLEPKELSAGVYFVRLEAKGCEKTEKVVLLK